MTQLKTLPLSEKCLEGLAETIAKFFAPDEDKKPPRRISPEIADCLQIEIKVIDPSKTTDQKTASNDECLKEMQDMMAKYLDEHNIPPETVSSFPSQKCLNELADVISEFFIQHNIPPETVGSLQVDLKYHSETQQGIVAVATFGCITGGPPHAPCPAGKKYGITGYNSGKLK